MKRLPLNFLLALLLLFTFTIVAFATETTETTEITESALNTENTESSESSITNSDDIFSSTEIPQDTPSENIENTDPTPKPNPDTSPPPISDPTPKPSLDIESTLTPTPKEPIFESAFSSLDVIAIRDDLYNIRKLMEDFIYILLPLFVAVVLIVLGCYWFYCTFIKGVL